MYDRAIRPRVLAGPARAEDAERPPRPTVQIAILLDTSNSMDGLIAQAKTQLWNVVNEFVLRAKRTAVRRPSRSPCSSTARRRSRPSEGFVRLVLPLTDDLDRVSEELFALKTNGGDEYCGWVIRDAVSRLEWSRSRDVYKAIFIAGNEPFSQGPIDFHTSCRAAIERGIIVNTIFCGPNAEGSQTGWKDGAVLADGRFMSIDQNLKVVEIPAPQDTEIARLGVDLNKTYLPFGKMGQAGLARQSVQDANASNVSTSVLATRSVSKSNAFYCNDAWDLVDAIKNGKCKLDDLKAEDLPTDLRKLDKTARKAQGRRGGPPAQRDPGEDSQAEQEARAVSGRRTKEAARTRKRTRWTRPSSRRSATRPHATTSSSSRSMVPKRILVVEDDAAIRRGLVDALGFAGYATLEATEGAAGLAAALESDCDLCLLDLVLPGRDGLTILRELRALQSPLPVIVLTARGAEDDRVRGLALGADDYVVKPFSIKELLARIEAVLQARTRATSRGHATRVRRRSGRPRAAPGCLR